MVLQYYEQQIKANKQKRHPQPLEVTKKTPKIMVIEQSSTTLSIPSIQTYRKLPSQDRYKSIQHEIQLTLNRQSNYFTIQLHLRLRDQLLDRLAQLLTQVDRKSHSVHQEANILKEICGTLEEIRKTNLICSQEIFRTLKEYYVRVEECDSYFCNLFAQFDQDFHLLKDSFMQYFIPLAEQFDPFLLQPVNYLPTAYKQELIDYSQDVEQLFKISPSYMFRLLRAKKQILQLMSKVSQTQHTSLNSTTTSKEKEKQKDINQKEAEPQVKSSSIRRRTIPKQQESEGYEQQPIPKRTRTEQIKADPGYDYSSSKLSHKIYLQAKEIRAPLPPIQSKIISRPQQPPSSQGRNNKKLSHCSSIVKFDISIPSSLTNSQQTYKSQLINLKPITPPPQVSKISPISSNKAYMLSEQKDAVTISPFRIQSQNSASQVEVQIPSDSTLNYQQSDTLKSRSSQNNPTPKNRRRTQTYNNKKLRKTIIMDTIYEKYKLMAEKEIEKTLNDLNLNQEYHYPVYVEHQRPSPNNRPSNSKYQ